MGTPFLGEIRAFSFNFVPRGWAMCQGQLLAINQNTALFAILGTTYGGNGITTFALPDLRGRVTLGVGVSTSLGQTGGEVAHTLTDAETPHHGVGVRRVPTTHNPVGGAPARQGDYNTAPDAATGSVGGGEPHENQPPYLVMSYAIALQGIFPSH
jgi:microcystin-dependent protein